MSFLDHPTRLSVLLLAGVLFIALTYAHLSTPLRPANHSFTASNSDFQLPYRLQQPDEVFELPNRLKEISGLETWSDEEVLCIQDEDGKVFIFNLREGDITYDIKFGKGRDYEGIARRDSQIYVLEADGDLHFFTYEAGEDKFESEKLETAFKYRNDLEGLCYAPHLEALLLTPKARNLDHNSDNSHLRNVYSLDPDSSDLEPAIVHQIDEYSLGQLVYGERKRFQFQPSSIAIQPETAYVYLLSAVGESLLVLNTEGAIVHLELLDDKLFPQPEGLTFMANGDLIVSSEGHGNRAVIATFRLQVPPPTDTTAQHE